MDHKTGARLMVLEVYCNPVALCLYYKPPHSEKLPVSIICYRWRD